MNLEIRNIPFEKRFYGRTKAVPENQKPVDVMFAAMDEPWGISCVERKGKYQEQQSIILSKI